MLAARVTVLEKSFRLGFEIIFMWIFRGLWNFYDNELIWHTEAPTLVSSFKGFTRFERIVGARSKTFIRWSLKSVFGDEKKSRLFLNNLPWTQTRLSISSNTTNKYNLPNPIDRKINMKFALVDAMIPEIQRKELSRH